MWTENLYVPSPGVTFTRLYQWLSFEGGHSTRADFAIDDGPHSLASQQRFLELYLPLLNDGGIAVIEDIQDYSRFDSLTALVGEDYTYEIVDLRGVKGRYDDLMLVVYK